MSKKTVLNESKIVNENVDINHFNVRLHQGYLN